MTWKVLVFVSVLVLAASLPVEDDNTPGGVRYCQPQTPCGWKISKYIDNPEFYLTNDYCVCRPRHSCQMHGHHFAGGYHEYRCKFDMDLN